MEKFEFIKSRKRSMNLLMAAAISTTLLSIPLPALAKKWTVTERLDKLSEQIDKGDKANELTATQVADLKKTVIDIKARIDKMKEKNGGKLGLKDGKKVHKVLNDLSVKVLRFRLDNVYK
ncbi:MAG TPA: hypothetical protein PKC98_09025 [Candidatus Melainabacteria bacterium]|nr:hypothetical protein [Candidatus Melainabacteria bacterium]